jgi:hypothetical protein
MRLFLNGSQLAVVYLSLHALHTLPGICPNVRSPVRLAIS